MSTRRRPMFKKRPTAIRSYGSPTAGVRPENLNLDHAPRSPKPPKQMTAYDAAFLEKVTKDIGWIAPGWWPDSSYGTVGGAEKTLKTWVSLISAVCIAADKPIFDHFQIVKPGPVVIFTGESGVEALWRRIRHIARSLDVKPESLPITVLEEIAPISSPTFMSTLRRMLREHRPVLVVVDPLYPYMGPGVDAGNLYDVRARLHVLSKITVEHGAALVVPHHTRKMDVGQHPSTVDLTQAGMREWIESWILLSHYSPPNLDQQEFFLRLTIGSRHGFGSEWALAIHLGELDEETGTHTGDLIWSLEPWDEAEAKTKEQHKQEQLTGDGLLLGPGWSGNAEQAAEKLKLSTERARDHLKALEKAGYMRSEKRGREAIYTMTTTTTAL
jgi:AAA domain